MKKCISEYLRTASEKIAMPWVKVKDSDEAVDFFIELLDDESRDAMINDLKSGKTIYLPKDAPGPSKVNRNDLDSATFNELLSFLGRYVNKHIKNKGRYCYNSETHQYECGV